jgi:hypothetical protein
VPGQALLSGFLILFLLSLLLLLLDPRSGRNNRHFHRLALSFLSMQFMLELPM